MGRPALWIPKNTREKRIYASAWNKGFQKGSNYNGRYYEVNKDSIKANMRTYAQARRNETRSSDNYNRPEKNNVRDKIIEAIQDRKIRTILTLESRNYFFARALPSHKIFVYEHDRSNFQAMQKSKPSNVILNFGEVSDFAAFDKNVDCIYLDFCSTLTGSISSVIRLRKQIKSSKLFAITLCPREQRQSMSDYTLDVLNRLQGAIGTHWRIIFGKTYKDEGHCPMFTILFENVKGGDRK